MAKVFKKIIIIFFIIIFFAVGVFVFYFAKKIPPGRTNFLILGIAGENHQGKDLTDTLIFLSVENQSGKTLILSIPRDIWIAPLRTKINSVYHYKGLGGTKKTVEEILGQPVNYGVVVDFAIFKKIIDSLGGITVNVERSFDDYKYPIAGRENDLCGGDPQFKCRYEHLHFEKGKQEMDGETALKFVRSRNAEGEEGTDFARAQRQQKVILAILEKILSPQFLFSPQKPLQLIRLLKTNIQTDIPQQKYWQLAKIALKIKRENIKTAVLNDSLLVNPKNEKAKYDNQWVLVPKKGNWDEVKKYVEELLTN